MMAYQRQASALTILQLTINCSIYFFPLSLSNLAKYWSVCSLELNTGLAYTVVEILQESKQFFP